MQLAGRLADQFSQPPFHGRVDVFIRRGKRERPAGEFLADPVQTQLDLPRLGRLQQANLRERMRPGDRTTHVLRRQPAVKSQRCVQRGRLFVQCSFDPACPQLLHDNSSFPSLTILKIGIAGPLV